MDQEELWKAIDGHEKYQASSLGRVRNLATGRILKPWLAGLGYYYVNLGKRHRSTVHRLVCRTFHGDPPSGKTDVAHYDGDRLNNHVGNLRWATRSENVADSIRHGTTRLNQYRTDGYVPRHNPNPRRGADAPSAKLNLEKAEEIRRRYKGGENMPVLARAYGVGKSTIFRVLKGTLWT